MSQYASAANTKLRPTGLHGRDHRRPVVVVGARAGALAPRALEDAVHHEHRHVAADAVALLGDRAERLDHGAAQRRRERVQLHDVGPGGEVRVAAVREHAVAHAHERRRVALEVLLPALDEVLGVRLRPRVVGRDVVGHEVEDQPEPARRERLARRGETIRAAEVLRHGVVADAVRRADDVGDGEAGQRLLEVRTEAVVAQRDRGSRGAPLPDSHQPHRVEPQRRDPVPLRRRHVLQPDLRAEPRRAAPRARPRC